MSDLLFSAKHLFVASILGCISSGPPGVHTGNLDNKDLIAGTTLFMPIHVPGALFSAATHTLRKVTEKSI